MRNFRKASHLLAISCSPFYKQFSSLTVSTSTQNCRRHGFGQTGEAFTEGDERLFIKERLSVKKGVHKKLSVGTADFSQVHPITNGNPFRKLPLHCLALCRRLHLHPLMREHCVSVPFG